MSGSVVVIGATSEIGKRIAKRYADQGFRVYATCRGQDRADAIATEIGGDTSGLAVDLSEPQSIAAALAGVEAVRYLVITAVDRDENTVTDYDIDKAISLVTLKMVGYTETVHTLAPRMTEAASIVLFGGLAKDRPYPGSTTITSVNGGITALIRTLAIELAPVRVNAIHPAVVGDSPYWANKPPDVLDRLRERTPLGELVTIEDIVHAVAFLLENQGVNGVNLRIDGGWMLT